MESAPNNPPPHNKMEAYSEALFNIPPKKINNEIINPAIDELDTLFFKCCLVAHVIPSTAIS